MGAEGNSQEGQAPAGQDPAGEAPSAPPAEPTPTPDPSAAADEGSTPDPQSLDALPPFWQKEVTRLRAENGRDRTESKKKAAEEAEAALTAKIAKALGLTDEEDPVKKAEANAQELEATKSERQALKIELAVVRAAAKLGASAESLTDSRTFMGKLGGLDPDSDDFAASLEAAIKEAIAANPGIKADPTPPRSGGPVGGGQPIPGQLTVADLQNMSATEINKARADGRLKSILGG